MKTQISCLFLVLFAFACGTPEPAQQDASLAVGPWQFVVDLGEADLEINTMVSQEGDAFQLFVKNADEIITADEFEVNGDAFTIKMPAFETEFRGTFSSDSIKGVLQDFSRGDDYILPFYGVKGEKKCGEKPGEQFGGRWAVYFDHDNANLGELKPNAVGVFEQKGNGIRGTFMTETGDYRYLEGCVEGSSFSLNTFDGAHIFRFDAAVLESGDEREMIKGVFRSGNHYQTPWVAVRDDDVQLRKADELTFLNPGYDKVAFSFPDVNGDTVSLTDERFQGRPVIVQIMGSWCPNCMDESRLYAEWYKKYNPQGLEIVGLAFERHEDFDKASAAVQRLSDRLDITYPMLIAGRANKTEAAEKLPMLNHVISFPTSIFIDKTGAVRKIHTGFNGPGTGDVYTEYVKEYEELIEGMLTE